MVLCQSSEASAGLRSFVLNRYAELKGANPKTPILVRECSGVEPMLYARYELGSEKSASVSGLDEKAVAAALQKLMS